MPFVHVVLETSPRNSGYPIVVINTGDRQEAMKKAIEHYRQEGHSAKISEDGRRINLVKYGEERSAEVVLYTMID